MGTSVNQGSPHKPNWEAAQSTYRSGRSPSSACCERCGTRRRIRRRGIWPRNWPRRSFLACATSRCKGRRPRKWPPRSTGRSRNHPSVARRRDRAPSRAAVCGGGEPRPSLQRARLRRSLQLPWRDLPGFVGPDFRNRTVADSFHFKQSVGDAAARTVREIGAPRATTAQAWRDYTRAVVEELKGGDADE